MKPSDIFRGPALVVIDSQRKTYARYFGRKHSMTVQGAETLSEAEVELYRTDPHKFMGIESPEVA
jgi:hypothetical protein